MTDLMMNFLESLSHFHMSVVESQNLLLAWCYIKMMKNIFSIFCIVNNCPRECRWLLLLAERKLLVFLNKCPINPSQQKELHRVWVIDNCKSHWSMMINEGLVIPCIELKKKVQRFFLTSVRGQTSRKLQLTRMVGEGVIQPHTVPYDLIHLQWNCCFLQVVYLRHSQNRGRSH